MKSPRRRISRLLPLALLAAGCDGGGTAAPPAFEGARPFALAAAATGATPTPADLERLVAAVIEVAGGSERLKSLSWRRVEDLYLAQSGNLSGNNLLCTTLVRPDESVSTQLDYRDGTWERRVRLRGEEYLQPNSMRAGSGSDGAPATQLRLATGGSQQYVEWDWEVARLPFLLAEAASLAPLPTRVVDGRTLVGIRVVVADVNPNFEAWIDLAGPMIVEVRAELPVVANLALASRADLVQRFADFRRVDGVLLPFRRDLLVDGKRFGLAEARSIEVDVKLADGDFGFP